MSLETTISAAIKANLTKAIDLGKGSFPLSLAKAINLTDGTAAYQASKIFSDERTLTASSSEDLDLAGSLVDPYGVTLTFTAIKAILIAASADNINDVIVGGAASNAFFAPFDAADNTVKVRPGGVMMLVAPKTGWTVTPTTADILKIANGGSGTDVTYDIVLVGI